jgi:hypothetical protein
VNNISKYVKDFHPILSSFKGFYMDEVFDIFKNLRELCGAHGYLDAANLTNQIEIWSPNTTLEGDGYVLWQQTTKDIFKRLGKMMKGNEIEGLFTYMNDFLSVIQDSPKLNYTRSMDSLIEIMKMSLLHQIMVTGNNLRKNDGVSVDIKWNKLYLLDIVKTAKLNAIYMSCKIFYEEVRDINISKGLKNTLLLLCKIHSCELVLKYCENIMLMEAVDGSVLLDISNWNDELQSHFTDQGRYQQI